MDPAVRDDVMIAASTPEELERLCQAWKDGLEQYGMKLNVKKTEYMECGQQSQTSIRIGGSVLGKTTQFRYLGSCISHDGDISIEVQHRVNAAWMKWRQVTGVLCDKRMPLRLKSKLYRAVVRPVAMYGSECWPTTKNKEQCLHTMETKMLR